MDSLINKSKIVFKTSGEKNDLDDFQPKKQINTYYQICQFKNKFTKKYQTRKIIFNELGNILKIYEKEYDNDKINNFIKHHRQNKYKIYPYYEIKDIQLPNTTDIICCQSDLLNNGQPTDSNYTNNTNYANNTNCTNYADLNQIKNSKITNKFFK